MSEEYNENMPPAETNPNEADLFFNAASIYVFV